MDKLDRVFKILLNRRTTDGTRKFYEEIGDSTLNIHMNEIWTDKIDSVPSVAIDAGIVEYLEIDMTENTNVSGRASWYAADASGNRLKDWISDKYGSAYIATLYLPNGKQIPQTDAISDWFFDYPTGILTFHGSTPTIGVNEKFKIKAWRYKGSKGVQNSSNSSIRIITFIYTGNMNAGVLPINIPFPLVGTISDINVSTSKAVSEPVLIDIEKCSALDYETEAVWNSILDTKITIDAGSKTNRYSVEQYTLNTSTVYQGDYFRINLLECTNLSDMTVEISIQV